MPFRSKLRSVRVRIIIVMSFLVIYLISSYVIIEKYFFIKSKTTTTKPILDLEYVIVHLDLKGAPPKLSYLKSLLPVLKKHGVNGLLIEYENIFPYERSLQTLRGPNCYEKNELQSYLHAAVVAGFEIIPLIQTFGHLEFALKRHDFAFMREVPGYPDSICPSSVSAQHFLEEMLKQIIQFHKHIAPLRHIHLGFDEVFHINKCNVCQRRNSTNAQLITTHLKFLIETVHILSPFTTVLIWDDMFRQIKPMDCSHLSFPQADVVYWDYTDKRSQDTHMNLYKYGRMFDNLWIATAFKGADGRKRILPNLELRFHNHILWLNFMFDYGTLKKLYTFKGIILTGWSRYMHSAPLCEILPGSIPSLIINLILIQKYTRGIVVEDMNELDKYIDEHIENSLDISLQCQNRTSRFLEVFESTSCHYEESDLYAALQNLSNKTSIAYSIIDDYTYKYFILKKGSSKKPESKIEYEYVDGGQNKMETCLEIFFELRNIENELIELLSAYFDNDVILEYVRSKVRRLQQNILGLLRFWNHKHSTDMNTFITSILQNKNKSHT